MIINHGSILQKEYFASYMKLIMNALECSIEEAKNITFQRLFGSDTEKLGPASYQEFQLAYEELQKKDL